MCHQASSLLLVGLLVGETAAERLVELDQVDGDLAAGEGVGVGLGRVSAERSEPPKAGATRGAKCAEPIGEGSRAATRRARRGRQPPREAEASFAASSLPSTGRASVRDPWPSAGQGVRRGAGICRAQTACLSAAVYKVRVGAMPRTRQNCSARQFLELSFQVTIEDTASTSPRPAPPSMRGNAPPRPAGCAVDEPQRGEIGGKPRRPKVERTSGNAAKWAQAAAQTAAETGRVSPRPQLKAKARSI